MNSDKPDPLKALADENAGLKQQISKLEEKLTKFDSIAREVSANEIFEIAKKKIVRWYTVGGVIVFLLSAFGLKIFLDYTEDLAKKKLEAITDSDIRKILNKQSEERLNLVFVHFQDSANLFWRQRLNEYFLTASSNVGNKRIVETTTSVAATGNTDYTGDLNAVENQGNESSGPAFALCTALEYAIFHKTGQKLLLSPRNLYNGVNNGSDYGVYLDKAFQYLIDQGVVENKYWPYVSGEFMSSPPAAVRSATHYKIKTVAEVPFVDYTGIRSQLVNNKIVVGNFVVYNEFFSYASGVLSPPPLKEIAYKNIAICVVGFDDNRKVFKCRNSWGTTWGEKGYFYIAYSDVLLWIKQAYVLDF